MDQVILEKRQRQVLYDKKWKKFLRRARLFRYIPFVEFAVGAGSLAVGNIDKNSDFDVIVGASNNRIFSARFFATVLFGIFGWRRSRLDHRDMAKDKICLNHFITEKSYLLKGPYTVSWSELYRNLVPVWGDIGKIRDFRLANSDWMDNFSGFSFQKSLHDSVLNNDLRYLNFPSSFIKKSAEFILSGGVGDFIERVLKFIQVKKIERSLRGGMRGYNPRIVYSDIELEFHPDRRKFENLK